MNSKQSVLAVAVAALFSFGLSSCSGVGDTCKVNCGGGGGGGGNASLNVTLAAEPLTPPPGTSILSFEVLINSVSLTPSGGGNAVNIKLNNSSIDVDLTRLQSDSAYLGQSINNIPAGTYNKVTVGITSAVVTYCTVTSGTPGCNVGSIAQTNATATGISTSNFSATLAANQQAGLRVVINFNNALTVNSNTQAVTAFNLQAANVLTTVTLPPAASTLSTGQLDYVDDVTGVVQAASASSVTILTATRGSVTSTINGSTLISTGCVIPTQGQTCPSPAVGQVASLDATVNADGTSTLLEYDPLSGTSVDLVEGIVTTQTTSATQFQIVANDYLAANSGSVISGKVNLGDTVNVTLTNTVQPFVVDSKGLTPIPTTNFTSGSTLATDILPGQVVMLRVKTFTAKSGNNTPASATADAVALRFTRVAASVSTTGSPVFNIQSLPPIFGVTTTVQAQVSTGSPSTYLDGYSSSQPPGASDNISMRALYFGTGNGVTPSFTAAKIRKN